MLVFPIRIAGKIEFYAFRKGSVIFVLSVFFCPETFAVKRDDPVPVSSGS